MNKTALLLAALALTVPAMAQAKPGDIQRHQVNAGTLDADGFTLVRTVTGGMFVEMPCKFNELSFADAPNTDGKSPYAKSATILLCVEPEKLTDWAMVLRGSYDTGAAGADHFFEQQFADDAKAGKAERLDYNGDKAFISLISQEGRCKWKLAVRHGADLVTINYFATATDCQTTKVRAERIMNSLDIVK